MVSRRTPTSSGRYTTQGFRRRRARGGLMLYLYTDALNKQRAVPEFSELFGLCARGFSD